MDSQQLAFRYEDYLYAATLDEWDEPTSPAELHVKLNTYIVIRTTPKGFWIQYRLGKRFILNGARKKFACLTMKDAKISFIARKIDKLLFIAQE